MKKAANSDVLLLQGAADPTRLAILHQLSEQTAVCACDFVSGCEVAQPTVSHHLKVLRDCGWVAARREGSSIWYSLRPDAAARFREIAGGLAPGSPLPAHVLGIDPLGPGTSPAGEATTAEAAD